MRESLSIEVSSKGAKVVRGDVAGIGAAAEKSAPKVDKLKRILLGFGAGITIAAVLGGSIRTIRDFSQEIATVQAVTGSTGAEFEKLSERARDLGATTRFTATQAAEGMTTLARAGFSVSETIETIDDVLMLAQAGAIGLGEASNIAASTLRGFRLETDQATRVVDVLALAANSANTTVMQLGEGMRFVAPVAAGVGVSLEEATAAMAALSDAGLQSSMAGTGLRRVLSELESPSTKTAKLLKTVGLGVESIRPSTVGLTQALKNLSDAGIDTGMALEIFGDRGGPAFEVLSSSIPKVEALNSKLDKAGGTARRIAEIMDANLNGAIFALKSSIEGLILELGNLGAESFITKGVRELTKLFRYLREHADDLVRVIGVAGLVGAVLLLKTAFIGLAFAIATNPLGALVTLLSAATAAIVFFGDRVKIAGSELINVSDLLRGFAAVGKTMLESFAANWNRGFNLMRDNAMTSTDDIEFNFVQFGTKIMNVLDAMVAQFISAGYVINEWGNQLEREILSYGKPGGKFDFQAIIDASEKGLNFSGMTDAFIKGMGEAAKEARRRTLEDLKATVPPPPSWTPPATAEMEFGPKALSKTDDFLDDINAKLEQQRGLLRLNNDEREVETQLEEILDTLHKKRMTTPAEQEYIRTRIESNQQLAREMEILQSLRGPQDEFEKRHRALDSLLKSEKISQEEYNRLLKDYRDELDRTKEPLSEIAMVGVGVMRDLGDAIGDLATEGSADFDRLAKNVIRALSRIAFEEAVLGIFGEESRFARAVVGRQHGGPVEAGRSYIVGERGQEVFTPRRSGRVDPIPQTQPQSVTIVNLIDPRELVVAGLKSGAADKTIVNRVSKNAAAVRAGTGR